MVIAPAKTGNLKINKKIVTKTLQTNNLMNSIFSPVLRAFKTVTMKLILPRMELTPARCNEKITKSILALSLAGILLKGGYSVQPLKAPTPILKESHKSHNLPGRSQNDIALRRG